MNIEYFEVECRHLRNQVSVLFLCCILYFKEKCRIIYYNLDYNNHDYNKRGDWMFIGRQEELQFLEEKYQSKEGQLIVIYGRRRIGKTETIKKFCENKKHIFYTCVECPDEQQLKGFSLRMLQTGMEASKYIKSFSDWEQAIKSILDVPGEGKKILVIDEFPYMVRGNGSIPSVLQKLWDETLKNENIMIILCGSAMSFIEKEILAEKNPLYGRATGIFKMTEMDFYDAIQFVPNYNAEDKITTYAILGGIPHYLKQFDDNVSLEENIRKKILTKGSILYSEVEFLLRQELRETSIYNIVIEAVALGNTKLNDIYGKTQLEKTKLSVYLKNLMDLGIVNREFSMSDGVKEQANVQRGLYRITDNYFRFWYAFVFPNMSELETGDVRGIYEYMVKPQLDNYTSYIFEDVCKEYLRKKNRKDELPFYFSKIGRWWNKTDELDIMATDYSKKKYILGECKYKNSAFTISDLKSMQGKFVPREMENEVYYWIFSKSGYSKEVVNAAKEEKLNLITMEDIILG